MLYAESGITDPPKEAVLEVAKKLMTMQSGFLIIGTWRGFGYSIGQRLTKIFNVEVDHPFIVAAEATPEQADEQGHNLVAAGIRRDAMPVPRGADYRYWRLITD